MDGTSLTTPTIRWSCSSRPAVRATLESSSYWSDQTVSCSPVVVILCYNIHLCSVRVKEQIKHLPEVKKANLHLGFAWSSTLVNSDQQSRNKTNQQTEFCVSHILLCPHSAPQHDGHPPAFAYV